MTPWNKTRSVRPQDALVEAIQWQGREGKIPAEESMWTKDLSYTTVLARTQKPAVEERERSLCTRGETVATNYFKIFLEKMSIKKEAELILFGQLYLFFPVSRRNWTPKDMWD